MHARQRKININKAQMLAKLDPGGKTLLAANDEFHFAFLLPPFGADLRPALYVN